MDVKCQYTMLMVQSPYHMVVLKLAKESIPRYDFFISYFNAFCLSNWV